MARSITDLAFLDSVITGAKDALVPAQFKGLRIGVPKSRNDRVETETARLMSDALAKLKAAGARLVETGMPGPMYLNKLLAMNV